MNPTNRHLCASALAALLLFPLAALAQTPNRAENVTRCDAETNDDLAIAACTALIQSGAESGAHLAVFLYNRGNSYSKKGQYDKAIADYDAAVRLRPDDAATFYNRGLTYSKKGEYDKAIADCSTAIRLQPDYGLAFNGRGNAYNHKGEYARAIADYDVAIRLMPANAIALTDRGYAYNSMGQYAKAIADFDAAIRLKPDFAPALNDRGYSNFYAGRFAAAASDFQRSAALKSMDAYGILWLHLARARGAQPNAQEFPRSASAFDQKNWPGPVVAFYLGHMNAAQVMAAAASSDPQKQGEQQCEATFYVGEKALLDGNAREAERLLRQARESCPHSFLEYRGADAELKRMGSDHDTVDDAHETSGLPSPTCRVYALAVIGHRTGNARYEVFP